ncbi:MAG: 50S ribosomal protein L29 [Candidatus Heimdallarchaeota archaeon]|nr:50S ribosomal protein L29 [Candidatus Heimdallarchaeota archaeon]MCK4955568.1 50S ribosomal protein L29 [Candidatus Heimdallarchaeota archaeon]
MTLIRPSEIRKMNKNQRLKKLEEYKRKLFTVSSELSSGGSIENPGQIAEYRKAIARILTIMTELDEI